MALADLIHRMLGSPPALGVRTWQGDHAGPDPGSATLVVRSPDALARVAQRPGELGLARAWVAGDLALDGDLDAALDALEEANRRGLDPGLMARLALAAGPRALRPVPPPPEEASFRGRRHSRRRDREAVTYHYDVSNAFYQRLLGPALTYSCAVFPDERADLAEAQATKHELVSQKLALTPGDRLLDVGCGWGSMLLHAAANHGAIGVGITLSSQQAALARRRVTAAELDGKVEIREVDYRDTHDGPFDAVCSIGMFEHVGRAGAPDYAASLAQLVRPGGRVLHHAISRPGRGRAPGRWGTVRHRAVDVATALGSSRTTRVTSPFMSKYVFPDSELFEVGAMATLLQDAGLEVRHVESLREHYARTLRAWRANLEATWVEAVDEIGERRARVWRLYLAGAARGFEQGDLNVHQVLAVRQDGGASHFPLRPAY